MTLTDWLAAIVLFLQLPIPLFWFVLHPGVHFWRRHQKAGYIVGLVCSWLPVTICLFWFHSALFLPKPPPIWRLILGTILIAFELRIFWRVHHDLGSARLVGKTELSGGGQIADQGIYGQIRHPRYGASFVAIIGACFWAATSTTWGVAAVWLMATLVAIAMEEREMRSRFGAAYEEYCRRVPRFIPVVLAKRA